MAFGSQDVSIFFRDGSLCVTAADGKSARVHLDFPEEIDQLGGQSRPGVVAGKPSMRYATGSLAIARDSVVTIDGVAYKVAYVRKVDDGLISVADLNKG